MVAQWHLFVTPGLGDNTYILHSEDEAVIIDPQRDVWRFLEFATARKLRIRYILETHVHNDYISGALEVRNETGATIAAPARGNYEFDHLRVAEGDEIRIGSARIVCLETPGHTQEHVAWLVYEESDAPSVLFSGGSLIVGGAGRTDLFGRSAAEELTRQQFHTVRRLGALPASTQVLPTHGAGSFCASSSPSNDRTTSVGLERRHNELLTLDEERFIQAHLSNLPDYPSYYRFIAPINRKGPEILKTLPAVQPVTPDKLDGFRGAILDMRNRRSFAVAHIPGSLNIELSESFGTYAGWVVPFNEPVLFVTDDPEETLPEAVTQLIRIGYERLEGYLEGGIESWRESGRTVASYETGSIEDLCSDWRRRDLRLIDVRQEKEWNEGHAKGSVHAFVGDLPQHPPVLGPGKWSVACASGYRASIAASILESQGIHVRLIDQAGVDDFLKRCPDAAV